jgi:hypothetical protein
MTKHGLARIGREEFERRAKRAFERRFGQSLLPLTVKPLDLNGWAQTDLHCKVIDGESGAWAIYRLRSYNSKIRMIEFTDSTA